MSGHTDVLVIGGSRVDVDADYRMRVSRVTELVESPGLASWFAHAYTGTA